jgi:chorismate synthase
MSVEERRLTPAERRAVHRPRPGHADLAGALKFLTHDARDVLERASARETAARVAAGALCRLALREIGVEILAHTIGLGPIRLRPPAVPWSRIAKLPAASPLRCTDPKTEARMVRLIDRLRRQGDSAGGVFEVVARGVPPGLVSLSQADRRLDGRLSAAVATIPAVKAVEIGEGVAAGSATGSRFHDEIGWSRATRRFTRASNRAGGIEGGLSNGEEIRLRGYLKPLSTLTRPLRTVDLVSKRPARAQVERTDATPILAAGVVGEAVVALVLLDAALEKFGGDTVAHWRRAHAAFLRDLDRF